MVVFREGASSLSPRANPVTIGDKTLTLEFTQYRRSNICAIEVKNITSDMNGVLICIAFVPVLKPSGFELIGVVESLVEVNARSIRKYISDDRDSRE